MESKNRGKQISNQFGDFSDLYLGLRFQGQTSELNI